MKKGLIAILVMFGGICCLLVVIFLFLHLPPVQQKIKNFALREIMKTTGNRLLIGNIRFSPFNRLRMEAVYISDLWGDTLLCAEKLDAGFEIFPILKKRLCIRTVDISGFDIRIHKDSIDAPLNFRFLLDAFNDDATETDPSGMKMEIDRISLKDGSLSYDVATAPNLPDSLFDSNHFAIRNFAAKIYLPSLDPENLSATVAQLSFVEKSGFCLKNLRFRLTTKQKNVFLKDFAINLPRSEITTDAARMDYTGMEMSEIAAKASYFLQNISGNVCPADLKPFFPQISEYPEEIIFSGNITGRLPGLNIPSLTVAYGKSMSLTGSATIADVYRMEKSAFSISIHTCRIDTVRNPLPLTQAEVSGEVSGALSGLSFNLRGKCDEGELALRGSGEYSLTAGNARLDVAIDRLTYKNYSCGNISFQAAYTGDSVGIALLSGDENIPLRLNGNARLRGGGEEAFLSARLYDIRLDALNLLPESPGATLNGILNIRIKGFNPETASASLTIDSLKLITRDGIFADSPISMEYIAGTNKGKQLNIRSKTLNLKSHGDLSFDGVTRSVRQAFPALFTRGAAEKETMPLPEENFSFFIALRQVNALSRLLGMKSEIPDSALLRGKYRSGDSTVNFDITAFYFFSPTDTCKMQLNISNRQNNLATVFTVDNRSARFNLKGNVSAETAFFNDAQNISPGMRITLNPGNISLNGAAFQISPAQIDIRGKRYEIRNFALSRSASEYLKLNGVVSENRRDSLLLEINRFETGTLLSALKYNLPLSGYATGEIAFFRLMGKPRITTRNFQVDNIVFDRDTIGSLTLTSRWSTARQGLFLKAVWNNPSAQESVVSGFVLPAKDSVALAGNIQGIQLRWFDGYLPGVTGELGAAIRIDGKVSSPVLTGTAFLKNVAAEVAGFNTVYRVSDSIQLFDDRIVFNNFTVYGENHTTGKINGTVSHKRFLNINPRLTMDFNRFPVLNNERHTDSLFFGKLDINGRLTVNMQNNRWLVQGTLTHGKNNRVMFRIPETVEAQRYGWITFAESEKNAAGNNGANAHAAQTPASAFPLKLNITLAVSPDLNAGVILNPATGDVAQIQGAGNISLAYDTDAGNINLQGTYTVEDGDCSISLKNITRKTFRISEGGKLIFRGDPLNTTFDLTAIYPLKASLVSLDPSFAEIASPGKIPVHCLLTAGGNIKKMELGYRILLPNEPAEIQRKLDGLLYTDDAKIKEIAYLLALGMFMPVSADAQTDNSTGIWTSIASSSVTSQLNNLLAGVLNDKWTVGTDLYSADGSMTKMDMDVNISARLFNDRLVVSSALGYRSSLNPDGQANNFTGDFDLEYSLSPEGNLLLRFFNVTNNQYYEKAKTTQGVGIIYKRRGKTFRQLFKKR
jgi:hypothetical protein